MANDPENILKSLERRKICITMGLSTLDILTGATLLELLFPKTAKTAILPYDNGLDSLLKELKKSGDLGVYLNRNDIERIPYAERCYFTFLSITHQLFQIQKEGLVKKEEYEKLEDKTFKDATTFFNNGVYSDMGKGVDMILDFYFNSYLHDGKPLISKIQPDSSGPDGLEAQVYQNYRSSLVWVYDGREEWQNNTFQKRKAIIFKNLFLRYSLQQNQIVRGPIDFFVYDISGKDFPKSQTTNNAFWGEIKSQCASERVCTNKIPSIIMYSKFDMIKGETPSENDGKVKVIDIFVGIPSSNGQIIFCLSNETDLSIDNWVYTNLIEPNGRYAVRCKNKIGNLERVSYNFQ